MDVVSTTQSSQERSPRFVSLLTKDTLALVLAGGRGTRLGALTSDRVKPAVPFAGKYRLIDFPLSNCINSGIRRMGVLTQYKAHSLINHLHNAWGFMRSEFNEFVEILPAQQRTGAGWYEGTADAVYQNFEIIRSHTPQFVLILGGDHVYKMDYGTMLGFHVERGASVTVGCLEVPVAEAEAFGVMGIDESGRVLQFQEKVKAPAEIPGKPGYALASMGIYIFDAAYLHQVLKEDAIRGGSSRDFGKDVLPNAVTAGDRVYAFPFRDPEGNTQGYWRDVGTLDSYWHANLELTGITPPLNLYDRDWPIWTYQVQAPPAKFVFNDFRRRGMAVDSLVSGGCIISGAMIRRSLLGPYVQVQDYSLLDECVVLADARISPRCRIKRAIIETGCVVPEGTVIGDNAEHDRKRFEVTSSGIVLVTPEMLGQELTYVR